MKMNLCGALVLALVLSACASNSDRKPQSVEPSVPTASELFLNGKFLLKPNGLNPLMENHYGEDLDLSSRRPVRNLTGTIFDKKYGRPGSTVYANFYHHGQFWIARVPNEGIENVEFQFIYFPPLILGRYIAAHSVLRIDTAPGHEVELLAPVPTEVQLADLARVSTQDALTMLPAERTDAEAKIRFLAVSAEAQWTQQDPYKAYDLKRGQFGAFIQIVRFESMEERMREFYREGSPVNQVKYPLKAGDGDKVLHEALAFSQRDGLSRAYVTSSYNCTTMAFDIVEGALHAKDPRIGMIRSSLERVLPVLSPEKLKHYGGVASQPLQKDTTLLDVSLAAYQEEVAAIHREVCPHNLSKANCTNIKTAIGVLRANHRL